MIMDDNALIIGRADHSWNIPQLKRQIFLNHILKKNPEEKSQIIKLILIKASFLPN